MLDNSTLHLNKKQATHMRRSRENNHAREEASKKDPGMCASRKRESENGM